MKIEIRVHSMRKEAADKNRVLTAREKQVSEQHEHSGIILKVDTIPENVPGMNTKVHSV